MAASPWLDVVAAGDLVAAGTISSGLATAVVVALAASLVGWLLMNLKTSRADGDWIRKVHPYRAIMAYIMPLRSESTVYFDTAINAEPLLEYLEQQRGEHEVNFTHCLVAAAAIALAENPAMNRFIVGRRMYQRRGRFITFSMKRKKLDQKSKLVAAKVEMHDGEDFDTLCARLNARIHEERSGTQTFSDKEFDLLGRIPRAALVRGVRLLEWFDYHNLLPASFIANDPLFTSLFIANLGSLKMAPGYHHLFEWGTCPAFMMAGAVEERAVVRDGELVVQKTLPLRWTYDERIDDGLTARAGVETVRRVLERPAEFLARMGAAAD